MVSEDKHALFFQKGNFPQARSNILSHSFAEGHMNKDIALIKSVVKQKNLLVRVDTFSLNGILYGLKLC